MIKIGELIINNENVPEVSDFFYEDSGVYAEIKRQAIIYHNPESMTVECQIKIDRMVWALLTGLWQWAYENCPNRRIKHLMKHGKNDRVKYKNFRRALREICWVLYKKGAVIVE